MKKWVVGLLLLLAVARSAKAGPNVGNGNGNESGMNSSLKSFKEAIDRMWRNGARPHFAEGDRITVFQTIVVPTTVIKTISIPGTTIRESVSLISMMTMGGSTIPTSMNMNASMSTLYNATLTINENRTSVLTLTATMTPIFSASSYLTSNAIKLSATLSGLLLSLLLAGMMTI